MKRCGSPDYVAYVVTPTNRIVSGWEFREDASSHAHDLPRGSVRVLSATALRKLGVDPRSCGVWARGDESDLGRGRRRRRR